MSEDEPKTYWESRVAKAKQDGTWDKPAPLPQDPNRLEGAMSRTARGSLLLAGLVVGWLGLLTVSGITAWPWGPLDFSTNYRVGLATVLVVLTPRYVRSYRILSAVESGREALPARKPGRALPLSVVAGGVILVVASIIWP